MAAHRASSTRAGGEGVLLRSLLLRGLLLRGALLRSLGDLVFQMAGLVIAAELAQRRFVQIRENRAQLLGVGIAGCETPSVNLAQGADGRTSVFAADFAVPVAVLDIEMCLAHAALPCVRGRQHPPAEIKWQLTPAQKLPFALDTF